MKVNHLIIGARDLSQTVHFYEEVLGYHREGDFLDSGTGLPGAVLGRLDSPSLLIVPFTEARLPSPQHIAFEVEGGDFHRILSQCGERGVVVRGKPELHSKESGPSDHVELGIRYSHFYVCDPSNVNIEIMVRR